MADHGKRLMSKMGHYFNTGIGLLTLGGGSMIRSISGLIRSTESRQIGADHREMGGQQVCHTIPCHMCPRMTVKEEHGRAGATVSHPHITRWHWEHFQFESFKHRSPHA